MIRKEDNLTGRCFGAWTVIAFASCDPFLKWRCRCSCGAERAVFQSNLLSGRSTRCKSCAIRAQWVGRRAARREAVAV